MHMNTTHAIDRFMLALIAFIALSCATAPGWAQETRARYVTIPINGELGVDTVPDGITRVLDLAKRDQFAKVIVLSFDSDGGSQLEAERIVDILQATGDRYERIGIVKRCIGPSLAILLTCDRIYIPDPNQEGVLIEFQAAWSENSDANNDQLAEQQQFYRRLVDNKPKWKPIIEALINPDVDLYAWETGPDQYATSNTPPADKEQILHIELTGTLGLNAQQAIAAGLAEPLPGGMDELGRKLGFEVFKPAVANASVLMKSAAKEYVSADASIDATIDRVFKQISMAEDLINDLPRQQYFAEQADPRSQKYRSSYNRSWQRDRWVHTGPSMRSWRKNTDNAIQQWNVLINTLDQIGALGREARAEFTRLQQDSTNWRPESERHEALEVLQEKLDQLLSQGQSLEILREQAVSQVDFFQRNRNNPVW